MCVAKLQEKWDFAVKTATMFSVVMDQGKSLEFYLMTVFDALGLWSQ